MKETTTSETLKAVTQFATINENKNLAYRTFGTGSPIIFANRFRGDLDRWDPAFLDEIAKSHKVIIFQYNGTGSSIGIQATTHKEMAQDILDMANFLDIPKFAVAGWSMGGFAAQVALTEFPERITHGILIGTRPPGKESSPIKDAFFEHALKPNYDVNDEVILFFNPDYPQSVAAAKASHARMELRTSDRVQPLNKEQWEKMIKATGFREDTYGTLEKMRKTKIPILNIMGEDDVCFAAEDWFKLKGKLPTVQMLLLPASGHGPQHQYPELSANYIRDFLKFNG